MGRLLSHIRYNVEKVAVSLLLTESAFSLSEEETRFVESRTFDFNIELLTMLRKHSYIIPPIVGMHFLNLTAWILLFQQLSYVLYSSFRRFCSGPECGHATSDL
jgi:hypothetical protein